MEIAALRDAVTMLCRRYEQMLRKAPELAAEVQAESAATWRELRERLESLERNSHEALTDLAANITRIHDALRERDATVRELTERVKDFERHDRELEQALSCVAGDSRHMPCTSLATKVDETHVFVSRVRASAPFRIRRWLRATFGR